MRGDRTKLLTGDFDGNVNGALVADLDHDGIGASAASEEMGDSFDWLLGGGETYAADPVYAERSTAGGCCATRVSMISAQFLQPLQRQGEMRAAFVICYRVDFIYDHRLHVAQNGPASFCREQ